MSTFITNISFVDLILREKNSHDSLTYAFRKLEDLKIDQLSGRTKTLSGQEQARLNELTSILHEMDQAEKSKNKADEVCDPLFVTARTLFNVEVGIAPKLRSQDQGVLVFGSHMTRDHVRNAALSHVAAAADPAKDGKADQVPGDVTLVALTLGLLSLDAANPPAIEVVPQASSHTGTKVAEGGTANGRTLYPKFNDPNFRPFTKAFFAALGEARSYGSFAGKVLAILAREGDPDGAGAANPQVSSIEYARVMRSLSESHVPSDVAQLNRRVTEALDKVQGVGSDDIGDFRVTLDDFNNQTDNNIVAENVLVMGPMIVSAMFEELKVFQVVDKIVEQFQHGMLPVGPGNAGKMLYKYWREAPNRMSELERRNFASMTLGVPGGEPGAMVNRDFNDLWIRFVSSVSNFVRQNEVDQLLRSRTPAPINQQQVRKSARDLAGNLTLHGYGMAHFAGRELTQQINTTIKLLGDAEIKSAYGARDMWQVVDQVATYDLGGAKTSSRYRTLASCGLIITAWLSRNIPRIVTPTQPIIDMAQVRFPNFDEHSATTEPNDYDLVNACELWLADTATTDSQVEEMSQPREAPQMTSKPIPIPAMAKELLEGIGDIGLGLGLNGGAQRFH
jgi:hypothetical protein